MHLKLVDNTEFVQCEVQMKPKFLPKECLPSTNKGTTQVQQSSELFERLLPHQRGADTTPKTANGEHFSDQNKPIRHLAGQAAA